MSESRAPTRMLVLVAVVVLASAIIYPQFSLNHDTSWYLVSTRMLLDGAGLYSDIYEINPPLAFYITTPALIISDLTHLRPAAAFFLYASVLGGLSVVWVYLIALRARLETPARTALFAGSLAGIFLLPMPDFGQREHLMLIFCMPYFVQLLLRERLAATSRTEAIAYGVVAFFGLGLKPYFLLIPAGIIVARFWRTRDWREFLNLPNISVAATLVGYLGLIAGFHPLYLEEIVPTASVVYSAFGFETPNVLLRSALFALAAIFALAILCRKSLDLAAWAMLGGVVGSTIAYVVQFKGWNYQLIPASFFVLLAAVWITILDRQRIRERVPLGIVAMTAALFSLGTQIAKGPYQSRTTGQFAPFVTRSDTSVLVLSTRVSEAFPFVNEVNARWTSRYPSQWLLPGVVRLLASTDCRSRPPRCVRAQQVLLKAQLSMVEDFVRHRPQLVFVDDKDKKYYFGGVRFDYIPFLLNNGVFAEIWQEYRQVGNAGDYQVWALGDYTERRIT